MAAIFLNIKAAYDNVLIDILVNRLTNLSILPIFCRFIYNLVSGASSMVYGEIEEIF